MTLPVTTRHHSWTTAVLAGVLLAAAAPARAQLIQSAPGSVGGLFGGHGRADPDLTATRWNVTFDVSGGVDREPTEPSQTDPDSPAVSGTAATAAMMMRFWRGRTGRFLELRGDGFVNRQTLAADQLRGLNGAVRATTGLGARTSLSGAFTASYQPVLLALGLPTAGPIDGEAPADLSPPTGVVEQRWVSTIASLEMGHRWTPRRQFDVAFTAARLDPLDGSGFQGQSVSLTARESWNLRERMAVRFGYRYDRNRQEDATIGTFEPVATHMADAGLRIGRRLSPSRTLSLTLASGLALATSPAGVDGTRETDVLPIGSVTFEVGLTRSWTLSAAARREVTIISGVSTVPLVTDQALVQLGGGVGRRLRVALLGSYSQGTAAGGDSGDFEGVTGSAQLQYGLVSWCAAFASYSYYRHELLSLASPVGFPNFYGRQAIRVGLSIWLPLYGTF